MKKASTNLHEIDATEADYLYVKTSQLPNAGNGLWTVIRIYKGEVIAVFKGEILTDIESKIRADKNQDQYFIKMLDGSIMDSINTKCFAKYANDAIGINSEVIFKNNSKIALDDDGRVCIIANRNILSGEEIFCSYGKKYWKRHG